MTVETKVGTFAINTSLTAGQTQAISGVGFQPKVVIFWWSGQTSATDASGAGDINFGIGWMVDATHRNSLSGLSLNALASTDTARMIRNDSCIAYFTNTTTLDGRADFSSFDSDGFTLAIDDAFAASLQVSYLALGGDEITAATTGEQSINGATGSTAFTGVGFTPSVIFMIANNASGFNGITSQVRFHLGWATGTAADEQGTISMYSSDNAATALAGGYLPDGEAFSMINSTASVFVRSSLVSFDVDGFTLDFVENTSTGVVAYLAIAGGNWQAGGSLTEDDTVTATSGTTDFTPDAVMFFSAARDKSTNNTASAHGHVSIGAATGASERVAHSVWMENGTADSECASAIEYDEVYINISDSEAVQGLMDVTGFSGTGWAGIMDDADPAAVYVAWLAVGGTQGGTQYEQAVGGSLTPAGSILREVRKTYGGEVAPTGSLIKQTRKTYGGALTPTGSLVKRISKTLAGVLSASGSLIKQTRKTFTGAVTPTGALSALKTYLRSLGGALTPTGQLAKIANKRLGGTLTPTGALLRQIRTRLDSVVEISGDLSKAMAKVLGGEVTPTGDLSYLKTFLISLSGALTPTGTLAARVAKVLGGAVTPTGTLTRHFSKQLSGAVTPTGRLIKRVFVRLSGAVTPTGTLLRRLLVETLGLPSRFRGMWRGLFKGQR